MRILIIEDEIKTSVFLSKGLRESGYVVDTANNGEDGLHLAYEYSYDLIILDVLLPKINGWDVIKKLKTHCYHTRILFLTACTDLEDRVKGLELGADDYLLKPFAFSELLARVRSSLRRGTELQPNILKISNLTVDLIRHKVTRALEKIDLTPKEFSLLTFLVQHQGEVMSRTLIAERVWSINFDTDTNIIDVVLRRLRQKIDDPFTHKLIHTVPGVGYVIEKHREVV